VGAKDATSDRKRELGAALRGLASRAAERSRGGAALVFGRGEGGAPRLLAAAGWSSADAARRAAAALAPAAAEALEGRAGELPAGPELPPRAAGGVQVLPCECDGQVQGVLAVGQPEAPGAAEKAAAADVAALVGLRLDRERLREKAELLESGLRDGEGSEKSEEVLRLSEALFAQDIELLRNQEKLGKVEKLKNDFIEKMSRELRTPLNSIIESIISVLTAENDTLSERSKASLRSALDDGTAFLRTLQNILDLWRIKQGELRVEIQDVNVAEVIEEAIFSVQDALADRPVRIEKRIDEALPKIRTDLAKISQILFLLLENAVKFTNRGRIELAARLEEGVLHCQVRDTGIGICPDDQQYVFDEFFQVDDSATNPGAGLGLALVRDLVVLLEGEIAVQSEVGQGTAVTLRLPVQTSG